MKNEYELLNSAVANEEEYEEIVLSDSDKKKLKKTFKRKTKPAIKKIGRPLFAAVIAIAAISPVLLSNEMVWASVLKLGQRIETFMNIPDDRFTGYKKSVNQTVENQNIKVTLNEIMLDDGQLLLSLNVNANHLDKTALGIEKESIISPGELKIKIGEIEFFDSSQSIQREENRNEDGSWNYLYTSNLDRADTDSDGKIDSEHYTILDKIDHKNDFDIDVIFSSMEFEKGKAGNSISGGKYSDSFGDIKGNWAFHTDVNGSKIISDTQVYRLDKTIPIKDKLAEGILTIKEVRVSPVSIKMYYSIEYTKDNDQNTNIEIGVDVEDDNGNHIPGVYTGSGTDKDVEMHAEFPIDKGIQKIKIIPHVTDRENESSQILKDKAFEVEFTGIMGELSRCNFYKLPQHK
ncbi:DUF4179 domain-containing protein [Bacillus sp. PAMC26568]|nr:DUF4179 domain-containing protein [Bacillus sp. PAMC26568]